MDTMCGWYVVSDGVKWFDCEHYIIELVGHDGVRRVHKCKRHQ